MAVVMGEVSGDLVCRDFDVLEAYDRWANEFPDWASQLPTVITRRGRHVYCRADLAVVRAASPIGSQLIKLADGELRGGNGYCLLPPSIHPEGAIYAWAIPPAGTIPRVDIASTGLLRTWCPSSGKQGGQSTGLTVSSTSTRRKHSSAKGEHGRRSRRHRNRKRTGRRRQDDRVGELSSHRLSFGRYRGRPLAEVPHSYLRWLVRTVTSDLYQAECWFAQQFLLCLKNGHRPR